MEVGKLTVTYRSTTGKNEARRLRAAGRVPGICYGLGADPVPVALEARALRRALDPEKRLNTVIRMTVEGLSDGSKELTVMVKDHQADALKGDLEHVDFVAIDVTQAVTVDVPILLVGKAKGVVDGGQVHQVFRSISVTCTPDRIPTKLELDISPLEIGDVLHASDLTLPDGVEAAIDDGETIVSLVAPAVEKTPAEATAEAGAEAEAAAGGAAPAGEKAAEKAPAKEEKKK
jgi:large subunit ribosomal protein L25